MDSRSHPEVHGDTAHCCQRHHEADDERGQEQTARLGFRLEHRG
jgi:hypothetical protein